MATMQKHIKAN